VYLSKSDDLFYIYVFLDPRKCGTFKYGDLQFNNEPFYIGKGKERRLLHHFQDGVMKEDKNRLKKNVLLKIFKLTSKQEFINKHTRLLYRDLAESEAFDKERFLINLIGKRTDGKGPLTNLTDGGDGMAGLSPWNKNKKCPIISQKLRGRVPWNKNKTLEEVFGKEKAEEYKKHMRKPKSVPHYLKGKKCPEISKRLRINLSVETENKICNLYNSGYGVPDVMKLVALSRGLVERVLKEHKVEKRTTAETRLLMHQMNK
jgi:hypothetical protein